MVTYCSKELDCDSYLAQAPTSNGICSVVAGSSITSIMKENDMMSHISNFFALPNLSNKHQRSYAEMKQFTMLINVHNTDILKSGGEGHVLIHIGNSESYINQVRFLLHHNFLFMGNPKKDYFHFR